MSSVIIVQGSSSAYLYVQECYLRGLTPVVVNPPDVNPDRTSFNIRTGGLVKTISVDTMDMYPAALEEVKKLDPVCVVAGNSGGVIMADKMAKDLGFKGNDPDTTWRRDSKNGMHQSLKEAGIRYIRTKVLESEKDLDDFWKEVEPKKVMMKFDNGAASVGNKVCYTLDEAKEYLAEMRKGGNIFGESDTAIVQEFIEGDEYIVDTVSCNGEHVVTDIWKYNKILTKYGDVIYDETNLVVDITPGMTELVKYAYKVLDATGFRYGPCHGEFKIDEKGPVLIETNARPIGASMTAEYLDECLGHHITDIALDSYLNPSVFKSRLGKLYRPMKYAVLKHMFFLEEGDVNIYPLKKVIQNLQSFRVCSMDIQDKTIHLNRTIDLETSPMTIKLCHQDLNILNKEKNLLYTLETDYTKLLYTTDNRLPGKEVTLDIDNAIANFPVEWNILVVTELGEYTVRYRKKSKISKETEKYDALIYADASESTLADKFEAITRKISMLTDAGVIVIAKEVYDNMPYKSAAMEILLSICKCNIEVPLAKLQHAMVGTKYS